MRRRRTSITHEAALTSVGTKATGINLDQQLSWYRIDLHMHTPASTDYQQSGVSAIDLLRKAEERGLDVIAFTDHNSVRGFADLWREIEDLELLELLARMTPAEEARLAEYRRLLTKVLLLPGFEFTATFGFHILAIFPETTSIRLMEHLLLTLGVHEDRFGSGEVGATSDVLKAYEVLADNGALIIAAHVNSSHGVGMQGIRFGGQTKIAYTQDEHLHAMEVTDLESTSRRSTASFFSGIKAEYPRRMHCIQGSDAHRLEQDPVRESLLGVGDRATEVLLPEASFAALKALFASNEFERVRPARPGGPAADALHGARALGNTANQAFHEKISQARAGTSALLRDIVAFANGQGGMIYAGVGPMDRKTVPGISDVQAATTLLLSELTSQVTPPLTVATDVISYGGKSVIALQISDGPEKPYALAPATILVRHGAETVTASRNEIVAMVRGIAVHSTVEQPVVVAPSPSPSRERDVSTNGSDRSSGQRGLNGRQPKRQESTERATFPVADVAPTFTPEPESNLMISTTDIYTEDGPLDSFSPRTGAEIVIAVERDGITYYAVRDLRNGLITHNVTRANARRLWEYAIRQREERGVDVGHIRWKGDFGFWKVYRPSRGERRFNLAYRGQGAMRIFYGVSEEGLEGGWRDVIPAARETPAQ